MTVLGPGERPGEAPLAIQVPLLILVFAFCLLCAFQTAQLVTDRDVLANLRQAQEPAVQEGARLRQQYESLLSKTTALANEGNAGAKAALDELRRQTTPPRQ